MDTCKAPKCSLRTHGKDWKENRGIEGTRNWAKEHATNIKICKRILAEGLDRNSLVNNDVGPDL